MVSVWLERGEGPKRGERWNGWRGGREDLRGYEVIGVVEDCSGFSSGLFFLAIPTTFIPMGFVSVMKMRLRQPIMKNVESFR